MADVATPVDRITAKASLDFTAGAGGPSRNTADVRAVDVTPVDHRRDRGRRFSRATGDSRPTVEEENAKATIVASPPDGPALFARRLDGHLAAGWKELRPLHRLAGAGQPSKSSRSRVTR